MSSSLSPTANSKPATISLSLEEKQTKFIDKFVTDLEILAKTLIDNAKIEEENVLRDDCVELQKFCAKLEILLQFKLKERKGLLSGASSVAASHATNSSDLTSFISIYSTREYWSYLTDALKSSRSFQDAVKYVKNLNEVKTNIGKARAFIRFCLHYHRLADAIQQLMMEEKTVNYWYQEKSVWHDAKQKSRIFQLLYDLNDVNFDLISKSNYELDTTWPTAQLNINKLNTGAPSRRRTLSITSSASFFVDREQSETMLSSTPLEMDDDLMFANIVDKNNKAEEQTTDFKSSNFSHEFPDEKNRQNLGSEVKSDEAKHVTSSPICLLGNEEEISLEKLTQQIQLLNEQINLKTTQNNELSGCLIKQTNFCENLSEMLKSSQERNADLEAVIKKHLSTISTQQADKDSLRQELSSIKFELSTKIIQEENLIKETLSQTQSINSLKQMCSQQELTINELRADLDQLKEERQAEINCNSHELQRTQVSIQLKEEENYLLNDQIQKLSKSLDEERKHSAYLSKELSEVKAFYVKLNEKNTSLITQLEMDNTEIKKRLVKLIKEKAELWQKADKLEYENLLKTNAMWIDDANVSNCMNCNNGFSLMLRKHHCRVCLKIYCYYCCNNWIEYNHSKLRVCKRCFDSKENSSKEKISVSEVSNQTNQINESKPEEEGEVESKSIDENPNVNKNVEDEEEEDADVNFEVRAEKLNSTLNSNENNSLFDENVSIYESASPKTSQITRNLSSGRFNKDTLKKTGCDKEREADKKFDSEMNQEHFDAEKLELNLSSSFKKLNKFELSDDEKNAGLIERKKMFRRKEKSISEKSLFATSNKKLLNYDKSTSEKSKRDEVDVNREHGNKDLNRDEEVVFFIPENAIDELDTFAVVSQEEISKIYEKK